MRKENKETGIIPSGCPSIYNKNAIEYIVKVLKQKLTEG
jgi:hypothetical protein